MQVVAVEAPGIDGRGAPEGIWRAWGRSPQKLKPKTILDASRKAFNDEECKVMCPTTTPSGQ